MLVRKPWYERMLRWGAISFSVCILIPLLGLMPRVPEGAWWSTEAGLIATFIVLYLFLSGLAGFAGAILSEMKNPDRNGVKRRNILYLLVALNFFAGPAYYFGYAAWRRTSNNSSGLTTSSRPSAGNGA
jgi:putative exporter of polyketide antibiotics